MNENKQAMLDALGMFFRVLRTESRMMADGYELQVTKADYNKAREALAALRSSAPQADVRAALHLLKTLKERDPRIYRLNDELNRVIAALSASPSVALDARTIEVCIKHLERIGARYHHGRDLPAELRALK